MAGRMILRRRHVSKDETPEEQWIRDFVGFYGTDGITRIYYEDLNGVPVIQVTEALMHGRLTSREKCDGPGAICVFEHGEGRDTIEATVFFAPNEHKLEILGAEKTLETRDAPDAA